MTDGEFNEQMARCGCLVQALPGETVGATIGRLAKWIEVQQTELKAANERIDRLMAQRSRMHEELDLRAKLLADSVPRGQFDALVRACLDGLNRPAPIIIQYDSAQAAKAIIGQAQEIGELKAEIRKLKVLP